MTPNSTVKQSLTVPLEPTEEMLDVAVSFALNVSLSGEYNWSAYMRDVWQRMVKAAPPSPDAELVELVRSKFPRIDPCKPVPLDEKAHCCEYTIYVERERLHRMIDAKLASLEVKS